MATWSSFEKDRLLAENWRKFLKDNPEDKNSQTVFGINSKDNPESLLSFLEKNQKAIGLTPEKVNQLVALMLAQTKEDDVVLEAIGGPQRDARTFSSDTTTKLNALINTFQLSAANKKKLEKVLNRWAKLNTVSFEQGAPATPVVPEYEPDEDKQASTEKPKGTDYEPYGATDATPEKRPPTDEEEASTGEAESVPSTAPEEKPAEKTVSTDTARPKRGKNKRKEKEETPSEVITRMLQGKGVNKTKINAFIEDIKALRKIEEAKKPLLQRKLGLENSEYKKFKTKHKDVIELINKLGINKTKFIEALTKLITQPAPTRQEPEAPAPDTSAESEPEAASPEPEVNREPEPTPESEPVPAKEEEPKEKTEEPNFTRRIAFKIKNYYNRLEIGEKLTNKFNIWKKQIEILDGVQSIEKFEFDKAGGKSGESVESFDNDKKDGLYLITLTNGEQFGLPKHTNDVSTLGFGFEWDGQIGNQDSLNKVTKLAKIKDGKIIKKGEITWGERGLRFSESILEESLMLRWKTIAGIK